MSQSPVTRAVTVTNADGIHARAAMAIAETVRRFDCRVVLVKGQQRADGTDVLQILSMGTHQGEQLLLEASGPQADEVLATLERLFAENFDGGDQRAPGPAA